nr:helix-turn-helix domain-containing protein [Priestia aryabhattai]MDH3111035.1 helix-turn-helix domain-containing protein [Priestia aryabhattai]MDH3111044.1 helix-turn-helix domain-containing protein [Priestia aryabhattai]MDH3129708.1 helix-turn-helix domain-containing protein [Priestia aryabhattai]MDH3129717.1 helix-turn-helix domain-containing protein [Priestia aryabhattai]
MKMAKEKIEIIASVETYKNLSSFESIDTLNETVRSYIERFKDQLNKTHVAVLKVLHGYSAKHLGVSFLTKRNIGKLVGKSRATIIRVCNHLEDLGIIKQLEMKRSSDMKQTSNAVIIQPIQTEESVKEINQIEENATQGSSKMQHQKNKTFLKQIHNIKHLNMSKETSKRKAYIKMVPKRLQQYQAFFGNQIKSLYGRIWLAMKNFGVSVDKSIMQEIAHIAFDKLVDYIKQGRNLSTEELHKLAYTIAYNQLLERDDTKAMASFVDSFIERTKQLKNHPLHSRV